MCPSPAFSLPVLSYFLEHVLTLVRLLKFPASSHDAAVESGMLELLLMFFTCISCGAGALLCRCCYLGVTAEVQCLSGAAGSGSRLCRQPAGAVYEGQSVLSRAPGLWERAADLGLLTPSCHLHHIHSCNVAAGPFGEVHACGGAVELGQRSAGVCWLTLVSLSMVCLELWGCRQAGSVPARQTREIPFYFFYFFFFSLPGLLSQSAFCR